MKGIVCTIGLSLAAATFFAGAVAAAEEAPTPRDEYVASVEPICEANTLANKRILENARTRARSKSAKQVKKAGGQFIHASAAFGATVGKIAAVAQPPEDEARLQRWIGHLRIVQANLRHLGKALKRLEKIKAAHEAIRVERSGNAANNVGFVFHFRYCRITPSRFT
jgi:Pyruvate/2-oxoacid:ferredoxin oxidoreductase gamma subunit